MGGRWVGLALAAFPAWAGAQTIRGTAVDATGERVPGVVILMLDDRSDVAARALTNEQGEFRVSAARAGDYRLRAMRVGFRPATTPGIHVGPQQEIEQRVELTGVPFSLDTVRVSGRNSCRTPSDSAATVFALWEQARTALNAIQLTSGIGGVEASGRAYVRTLAPWSYRVMSETTSVTSGLARGLWRSRSPELLRRDGYIVPAPEGGTIYYAPDLAVLLSDAFLEDHCFRLARGSDGARLGVEFEPTRERRGIAGIRGTMWFHRPSAELRRIEFRYTNAKFAQEMGDAGGLVDFARTAAGAWLVSAWHIRMPILEERQNRVGTSSAIETVVREIKVEGGEMNLVTRGRDTVWARPRNWN